jgi:predicted CxxxxCH...CXXCH cytochrome family protein
MLDRTPLLAALAALALALAACGDARSVQEGSGGGACTSCHGDAARVGAPGTDANLAAAPPREPTGEPAQVVGAHQAHLNPDPLAATPPLRGPIACAECHQVPGNASHATTPPAQKVHFGTLATTGGVTPTWNGVHTPTGGINTPTCSSVYCHGNFTFGGVSGNAGNTPDWTVSGQPACTTCHAMPPTGHFPLSGTVTAATCNGCHSATVDPNGRIVVAADGSSRHVNGQQDEGAHPDPSWLTASGGNHTGAALSQSPPFQSCLVCHASFGPADPNNVAGSSCNACHAAALTTAGAATTNWQQNCVFCHGDGSQLASYAPADQAGRPWIIAPPVGALGETLTTQLAVGAHQKHVNSGVGNNVLSNPIACAECHTSPLPSDIAHVDGVVGVPLAGPLATTATGTFTPSPTWNTPVTAGCAATYCHGNYPQGGNVATPVWTTVDGSFAACASCHGAPPDTGTNCQATQGVTCHLYHVVTLSTNCSFCHFNIATGSGAAVPIANGAIVGQALHVNGLRNVVFQLSPGTATWTPAPTPTNAAAGTCSNVGCHSGTRSW